MNGKTLAGWHKIGESQWTVSATENVDFFRAL